jgi:hypothetical protein
MSRSSVAKYYVVFEGDRWKVQISEPYSSGSGNTVLRTFGRKRPVVKYGKKVARNQNRRLVVNYNDGRTGQQRYDYRK